MHIHPLRVAALLAIVAIFAIGPLILAADGQEPSPWNVIVNPTLNPLPVGLCGAVQLKITDASGQEIPRNPQGFRITMADFDMSVASEDGTSVAGQQLDANHWSVCACQGAPRGTIATVTASYPAKALSRKTRVAGVAFQTKATVEVAAPKGSVNPPACEKREVVESPARSPQDIVAAEPIATVDSANARATESLTPIGQDAPPRPAKGAASVLRPNPANFTAVDRGLGTVDFKWDSVPNAVRYKLTGTGIPASGFFTTTSAAWYPKIPPGPGSWSVVAIYTGGVAGEAPASVASAVVRVLPPHSTPWLTKNNGAGLIGQVQAPITHYFDVFEVGNNTPELNHIAAGRIGEVYSPEEVKWLGERLGFFSYTRTAEAVDSLPSDQSQIGLKIWLDTNSQLWDEITQGPHEAVYGNAGDLGVGRRTFCEQKMKGPPEPGMHTWCYATAHGIPPGQAGFNNLQTITHPGEGFRAGGGNPDDFILAMVILKGPTGSVFLVFAKDGKYKLSTSVQLDTEGPKLVPFACLSCHGGTYNPVTRKVDGASLLPLDPNLLAFATPAAQALQEEKIRAINMMILNSAPTSAIATYIKGLYDGVPALPGKIAKPDYVPAAWAPQTGFYRSVVRPYCAMCHLAAPSQWNFASWNNFESNGPVIHASVCGARTMPHSELQFKSFWTKDTGSMYLPGLLAATLGRSSCP